ncbi:MAG TPA: hypothetical protein VF294_00205, partial [Polyangiaceae bacterium]
STAPEAPAGMTQVPELQTPLAQSGPVLQVVLGSSAVGMQSPPVQVPLWQSLAWLQDEPAGTPELEPPLAVEPPPAIERFPPETDKLSPPEVPGPVSCPMSASLPLHAAKAATTKLTKSTRDERLGT